MCKIKKNFSFFIPVIAFAILVVLMAGCEREKASRAEEFKAALHLLIEEAWNKGNLDVYDEHCAADIVAHRAPYPDIEGLEALKQVIAEIRSTYPYIKFTIDEIIVEGETTALRWTWQGTAPTGKQVTMKVCNVEHWAEGKIVEVWAYLDNLGWLQQFGFKLIPPQEEGEEESEEESQ